MTTRHKKQAPRGFTLVEVMVASVVGLIVLLGVVALAKNQVQSFGSQEESLKAQAAQRIIFEAIAKDIRNTGYGMGFYAGISPTSQLMPMSIKDSAGPTYRGIPAIRVANNISAPNVMPGSDAVMAIRVTSAPAHLTTSIPCGPGVGTSYTVDNFTPLIPCARAGGFVLVSDQTTPSGVPAAVMYQLAQNGAANANTQLTFASTNIAVDTVGCTDGNGNPNSLPPRGSGSGSTVVCVQPVTYWIDSNAQLRLWQATASPTMSNNHIVVGANGIGRVIISDSDAVLADGVQDLQVSVFMSNCGAVVTPAPPALPSCAPGPLSQKWLWTVPYYDNTTEEQLAEARIVRITALVRSTRMSAGEGGVAWPAQIEDHTTPTCAGTGPGCWPAGFDWYTVAFESPLRSMRIFDSLSDINQPTNQIRSYK